MLVHRHYNRNEGNRKRNRVHPDTELNARLAATPIVQSEPSLRGIGIVSPPGRVRVTAPKRTHRIESYLASNGARIAIEPMPGHELARLLGWRRETDKYGRVLPERTKAKAKAKATPTPTVVQGAAQTYQARLDKYHAIGNGESD